jgi:hypothetical protein
VLLSDELDADVADALVWALRRLPAASDSDARLASADAASAAADAEETLVAELSAALALRGAGGADGAVGWDDAPGGGGGGGGGGGWALSAEAIARAFGRNGALRGRRAAAAALVSATGELCALCAEAPATVAIRTEAAADNGGGGGSSDVFEGGNATGCACPPQLCAACLARCAHWEDVEVEGRGRGSR